MHCSHLVLGLLFLLVTGCTTLAPSYERPQELTPHSYQDLEDQEPTLVATLDWNDFFTDPKLQALINQALDHNHDLRAALLRVEEARAAHAIARSQILPTISTNMDYQRSKVPADFSPTGQSVFANEYQLNVGLTSWELDFWGRIKNLKDAALQDYLATEEAFQAITLVLIGQVAEIYLVLQELDQRIFLANQALATRKESLRVFTRRVEVGSSSRLELVQAELLWQQAQALLTQLQLQRDLHKNALALVVGNPELSLPYNPQPLLATMGLQPLTPGLPSQLLENRPDIRAAEHELQATHARIGAARAMYFPRIALTSMAGVASTELESLFTSQSRTWIFAPSVSLPIFDGGQRRAQIQVSQVRRDQALNRYAQVIQNAFRDVANALAGQKWLQEQLQILQATQDTLQERSHLARRRFEAGAARYFEVLDAERDLLNVQQQVVQAEHACLKSRIQLYIALGGGTRAKGWPGANFPEQLDHSFKSKQQLTDHGQEQGR